MADEYARQVATAKRLIAKKGKFVTWSIPGERITPNPLKPWEYTETEPSTHTVKICFLPVGKEQRESLTFFRGTEIPIGSVLGYMAQTPFIPNVQHSVIDNGAKMDIDSIDILAPNGTPILYTVIFKK